MRVDVRRDIRWPPAKLFLRCAGYCRYYWLLVVACHTSPLPGDARVVGELMLE